MNHQDDDYFTPLSWGIVSSRTDDRALSWAQFLLSKGADVNFQTNDEYTPAQWAVHKGFKKTFQFLLDNGASCEPEFLKSYCGIAALRGNTEILKFLFQKHTELLTTPEFRERVFFMAVSKVEMLDFLMAQFKWSAQEKQTSLDRKLISMARLCFFEPKQEENQKNVITWLLEQGASAEESLSDSGISKEIKEFIRECVPTREVVSSSDPHETRSSVGSGAAAEFTLSANGGLGFGTN